MQGCAITNQRANDLKRATGVNNVTDVVAEILTIKREIYWQACGTFVVLIPAAREEVIILQVASIAISVAKSRSNGEKGESEQEEARRIWSNVERKLARR